MTYLDPSEIAKLGALPVKARLIVEGALTGLHRARQPGQARLGLAEGLLGTVVRETGGSHLLGPVADRLDAIFHLWVAVEVGGDARGPVMLLQQAPYARAGFRCSGDLPGRRGPLLFRWCRSDVSGRERA